MGNTGTQDQPLGPYAPLVGGLIPAAYLPASYVATAGTPVVSSSGTVSTYTITLAGVTPGQPIIVANVASSVPLTGTPITDTFSTPYTWTKIDAATTGAAAYDLWIGTGGAGSSGVITVHQASSVFCQGVAIPLLGASVGSGLGAVDTATAGTWIDTTTNVTTIDTTGTGGNLVASAPGELWIVGLRPFGALVSPGSPWTVTTFTGFGAIIATLSNPAPGWQLPEPASGVSVPKGLVGVFTQTSGEWHGVQAVIKSLGN